MKKLLLCFFLLFSAFATPVFGTSIEQQPSFPGGNNSLMRFIETHMRYPKEAKSKGIEGRVVVSFYVETDGRLSNFKVVRSVHPLLDAEALRIVKLMPRWIPGRQSGKLMRYKYNLPIKFELDDATEKARKAAQEHRLLGDEMQYKHYHDSIMVADYSNDWPLFGIYVLDSTYYEGNPKPITTAYHQYKVHYSNSADILWVYDKGREQGLSTRFNVRYEQYRPKKNLINLQLLSVTDSGYTQRYRKESHGPWIVEVWKKTRLGGIALDIVRTLANQDATKRLYGTYINPAWGKGDHRVKVLMLSDKFAIEGNAVVSDPADTCRMEKGVPDNREFTLLQGEIYKVDYPSDNSFVIGVDTVTVADSIMGKDYQVLMAKPLDGMYRGYKKQYLYRNGFWCLSQYADKSVVVVDGNMEYTFLYETADSVLECISDCYKEGKGKIQIQTWCADDGQGYVIAGNGFAPVRTRPDNNDPIFAYLWNPHYEESSSMGECFGMEGDWYKVKIHGGMGYVNKDNALWVACDTR